MADPMFHKLMGRARAELASVRDLSEQARRLSSEAAEAYAKAKRTSDPGFRELFAQRARRKRESFADVTLEGKQALARARDLRAEAAKLLGGKK